MRSEESPTYVGIDVIRVGSKLADFRYAIAVVKDGNVEKIEEGGIGKIIRTLWENRPSVLAVDNIYELGGTSEALDRVIGLMPPDTRIVQVTLTEKGPLSLREAARLAGLSIGKGHPTAEKTAVINALLAARGIGKRLDVVERRVRIIVAKGRGGYAGGSKSEKFQRRMRAAVARMMKRIREKLDSMGLTYELYVRRSVGGIERAVFIVYASRDDLKGVISNIRSRNVRVIIKPTTTKKVTTVTEGERKRYLIIGIDPGIESGLAILDIEGKLVALHSAKEFGKGDIVSVVSSAGVPLIVSADTNPPPEMVKKVAAMLGAQLYYPPRTLSTSEKEEIVREFATPRNINVRTTHERDALAAAVLAYRSIASKLEKLRRELERMGLLSPNIHRYAHLVVKDVPLAEIVETAINDYLGNVKLTSGGHSASVRERRESELAERINELIRENEALQAENDKLRKQLEDMEARVRELERRLEEQRSESRIYILRDRKIRELQSRVESLTRYVDELRREVDSLRSSVESFEPVIYSIFRGYSLLVRHVKDLEDLRKSEKVLGMVREGEYVLVDEPSPSVADYLSRRSAVMLVRREEAEELMRKYRLPVATVYDEPLISVGWVSVMPSSVMLAVSSARATLNKLLLEDKRKKELTVEKLEALINAYRSSREIIAGEAGDDKETTKQAP